jgi:hypothetical protein
VLEEWHRLLKPGGRLLFTDPIVLTGPVTNREVAIRASIGLFVFVPAGLDETMLERAGFEVEGVEDHTQKHGRERRRVAQCPSETGIGPAHNRRR